MTQKNFSIPEYLLEDTHSSRFSAAEWFEHVKQAKVAIFGAGGIGSNLAWQLIKTSPRYCTIIDDDTVDSVNMGGQFFTYTTIGRHKASELAKSLADYNIDTNFNYLLQRIDKDNVEALIQGYDAVFLGFDNMSARKVVFEQFCKEYSDYPALLIDGRCSATDFQVYAIPSDDPDKIERYRNELFTDEEADATICSFKQTAYIASMTASCMMHAYINWFIQKTGGFAVLPFKQEFNSLTSDYTTIM